MNKITIIQLLNKIANGEEVPKLIKYNNVYFKWHERLEDKYNYKAFDIDKNKYGYDYLEELYIITSILNDEVEIIEENKLPEKIDLYKSDDTTIKGLVETINVMFEDTTNKINEIIDYLESKEKGE